MKSRKLIVGFQLALFFLSMGQTLDAWAGKPTDAEIKLLPPYCEARLKRTPESQHWRNVLGPDYMHTHHLCEGMIYVNRYPGARTKLAKATTLNSAMGNLNYMVTNASPSYSLMPDVYFYRGQVFAYQNNIGKALEDLNKAIDLQPQYTRAYVLAADLLVKAKHPEDALKLVTRGLQENPGDQVLQRVYDRLGGPKPYPEPKVDEKGQNKSAPTEDAAGKSGSSGGQAANTPHAMDGEPDPAASQAGKERPVAEGKTEDGRAAKQTIGSPTNPWCRFCPDSKD